MFLLRFLGEKVKDTFGSVKYVLNEIIQNKEKVTILNIGSSHAESLDFNLVNLKNAYSFTGGFYNIQEIRKTLQFILPKLKNIKIVCVAVPEYVFDFDNSGYRTENQKKFRERVYATTNTFIPLGNDIGYVFSAHLTNLIRADHWKPLSDRFLKLRKNVVIELDSVESGFKKSLNDNLKEHAEKRIEYHIEQISAMHQEYPELNYTNYHAIKEIVADVIAMNAKVIFYTPPYHSYYLNGLYKLPIDITKKDSLMKTLIDKNVSYFDFSKDIEFRNSDSLFKDSDHLNAIGSQKFSQLFIDSVLSSYRELRFEN